MGTLSPGSRRATPVTQRLTGRLVFFFFPPHGGSGALRRPQCDRAVRPPRDSPLGIAPAAPAMDLARAGAIARLPGSCISQVGRGNWVGCTHSMSRLAGKTRLGCSARARGASGDSISSASSTGRFRMPSRRVFRPECTVGMRILLISPETACFLLPCWSLTFFLLYSIFSPSPFSHKPMHNLSRLHMMMPSECLPIVPCSSTYLAMTAEAPQSSQS